MIWQWLIDWCIKRGNFLDIPCRKDNRDIAEDVYLRRYMVISSRFFCFYIHDFHNSDKTFHDHPWNFFTYIIKGSYAERHLSLNKNGTIDGISVTIRDEGSIEYRRATDIHRVEMIREGFVRTACFMGPRLREWGFWTKTDNSGLRYKWTLWTDFLEITPEDPRYKGSK